MIEITANALDQASNRVRALWLESRLTNDPEGEGLHAWLRRMARAAIEARDVTDGGKYRFRGMKFGIIPLVRVTTFRCGEDWLLQSVERIR